MRGSITYWWLALLVSSCFTLGTLLQPRAEEWNKRDDKGGLLQMVFGEGRRLFANQAFTQADIYFHSGYYPSIFDQAAKAKDTSHLTAEEHDHHDGETEHHDDTSGAGHNDEESEHYRKMALKRPHDWIESFGRRFMVTTHTHLAAGNEREMLPWLKLSAELNPQSIQTYTVAAYWLQGLGKVQEAEDFLRLGLKNNPDSYELLFELGRLLSDRRKDDERARNIWRMALQRWKQQEEGKEEPDRIGYEKIVVRLAMLEQRAGNIPAAIEYFKMALKTAPDPAVIQQRIDELETTGKNQ